MKTLVDYQRSRRRGYSLIETVVVVGAVTIVLSLCGLVLHALMRLDRSGRRAFDDAATVSRLAHQFRDDVRSASSAKSDPARNDKPLLVIGLHDDKSVNYALEGRSLIRTEIQKDGKVESREAYRVDRLGPVSFETTGIWVRLKLARTAENATALPRPLIQIEARLSKDVHLGSPTEVKP